MTERLIRPTGHPPPLDQIRNQVRTSTGLTHAPGGVLGRVPSRLDELVREAFGTAAHDVPKRARRLRAAADAEKP